MLYSVIIYHTQIVSFLFYNLSKKILYMYIVIVWRVLKRELKRHSTKTLNALREKIYC